MVQQLGSRYLLEGLIASGSMGDVYYCRDVDTGALLAAKLLRTGLAGDQDTVARFLQERQILARISHRNVVDVKDLVIEGDTFAIVMELIPGGDLADALETLDPMAATSATRQIAEGLQAIHANGIIHRDLKPANILMVENDGGTPWPKISDFGVSRLLDSTRTRTSAMIGTPRYIAPESIDGAKNVTNATDVYALGAILFELLVKVPPFGGETLIAILSGHATRQPPRIGGVPDELADLIDSMLEKAPNDRPGTSDVIAVLGRLPPELAGAQPAMRTARAAGPATAAQDKVTVTPTPTPTNETVVQSAPPPTPSRPAPVRGVVFEPLPAPTPTPPPTPMPKPAKSTATGSRRSALLAAGAIGFAVAAGLGLWFATRSGETTAEAATPTTADEAAAAATIPATDLFDPADFDRPVLIAETGADRIALPLDPGSKREATTTLLLANEIRHRGIGLTDEQSKVVDSAAARSRSILAETSTETFCCGAVLEAIYSPDGETVASLGNDGVARLWAAGTDRLKATLIGHRNPILGAAFSPDGSLLATASSDGTARIWAIDADESPTVLTGHGDGAGGSTRFQLEDLAFNPSGTMIATAGYDGTVRLWDVQTREQTEVLVGQTPVHTIAFSPDGASIAAGDETGGITLWGVDTGEPLGSFLGHEKTIRDLAFSPDGRQLASASNDGTIVIWDPQTLETIRELEGHIKAMRSINYGPGGRLISSGADEIVRIWDTESGEVLTSFAAHKSSVWSARFSPDGTRAVTAGDDGDVIEWDLATGAKVQTTRGHTSTVNDLIYSPGQPLLAAASDDGTLRLLDPVTGLMTSTIRAHERWLLGVAVSPDGSELATSSADGTIKRWDVESGNAITVLDGHTSWAWGVAYSPDGSELYSGSLDKTIRVWSRSHNGKPAVLEANDSPIRQVAVSRDGIVAAANQDGTVQLWNPSTGENVVSIAASSLSIKTVAFSPDGTLLATAGNDLTINLWDPSTGAAIATLEGHSGPINDLAFSADGRWLASAGSSGIARLWDLDSAAGSDVHVLDLGRSAVSVDIETNGRTLAVGGVGYLTTLDLTSATADACDLVAASGSASPTADLARYLPPGGELIGCE